jgi:hypothetical protein
MLVLPKMATEYPPAEPHHSSHNSFETLDFFLRTVGRQRAAAARLTMNAIPLLDREFPTVRGGFQLLLFRPWNLRLARAAIAAPLPAASQEEW